jgi:hypothetical protein
MESDRYLNYLSIGLVLVSVILSIPMSQAVAMQSIQTSFSIQRVVPTPGSISFDNVVNRFQRDFLLDVSGSLKSEVTPENVAIKSAIFVFTLYKDSQIVQAKHFSSIQLILCTGLLGSGSRYRFQMPMLSSFLLHILLDQVNSLLLPLKNLCS